MVRTSGTSPVSLVIWSVWFIWSVYCNQTNQTDRTDQMNKTGWRTFSASCQTCLFSVASCNSDQILGGVFLATCGDLSASPPDPLS